MVRINLLPVRASRKEQAGRRRLALAAAALVLVVGANAWWVRSRAADLAAREAKLRKTRADIAQLERIIGEVRAIKAEQAIVKDKLAVLDKLKAGRQGPVRVLDELATIVPSKVWMRKLEEKAGVVSFDGTAASIDDVSLFLGGLRRSRYFSSPELRKTTARTDHQLKLVDFSITASVNYTPVVQAAPAPVSAAWGEKR